VLAAGNGDRFQTSSRDSKLLREISGVPLIARTLGSARDAGIGRVHVVIGYQAEAVQAVVERLAPPGLSASFVYNPDWQEENGVSVLAARPLLEGRRFALLMGDHVFEPEALARLLRTPAHADDSLLAVDPRASNLALVSEATKVRLDGDRITAIGKDLAVYDALDMGMFVFAPGIFDALALARAAGDTSLSGGVRRLAAQGRMRGVDVGDSLWYDIDTVEDLRTAEALLRVQPEPA
jgi:choline kinase